MVIYIMERSTLIQLEIFTALCLVIFIWSLTMTPITTNDFWIQARVGKDIVDNLEIPDTCKFNFTNARNFRFIAYEWLPSILFYELLKKFGILNLQVLKFFICLFLGLTLYCLCYEISKHSLISLFITALCLATSNFRHFLRPEIFGYLFLTGFLFFLIKYYNSSRKIWLIVISVLTLIWTNTHGTYLLALILVPIFLSCDLLSLLVDRIYYNKEINWKTIKNLYVPLIIVSILLPLICLINPFGYHLITHSIFISSSQFIRDSIFEWLPTFSSKFIHYPAFYMYFIYLCVLMFSFVIGFRKTNIKAIVIALVFFYLSIEAQRHIAIFSIVTSFCLATNLRGLITSDSSKKIFAILLSITLIGSTCIVYEKGNMAGFKPGFQQCTRISKEAIKFITTRDLKGNAFNSYPLGSQLIYNFYPRIKVCIDSRIDVFGEKYWRMYKNLFKNENDLTGFIKKYKVKYLILTNSDYDRSIVEMKNLSKNFKMIYSDKRIVILEK